MAKDDKKVKSKNKQSEEALGRKNRRLVFGKKSNAGRNNSGKMTVERRGGGHKRLYRKVDFKRFNKESAKVLDIQKDPNRSALVALVEYKNGKQSYILANQNMKVGDKVKSGDKVKPKAGNRMKLKNIPLGSEIYNIELKAGGGGKLVRSAGNAAQLKAIEGSKALIKLPSKELRLTSAQCYATLGSLSNPDHRYNKLEKAGQSRHLGKRPKVRGKAKHPAAHPHGGGEGNTGIGMKYPKSSKGRHSLGKKTRKKKKYSDNLIVSRGDKK